MSAFWCFAAIVALNSPVAAGEPQAACSPEKVRAAVKRGLKITTQAAANYPNHQTCFSCHHQTLPLLAAVTARDRKLAIDEKLRPAQSEFSRASFHED